MKTLDLHEMENVQAGDFVDGLCAGIAAGTIIYQVGVWSNWWNPVGWVSASALVASAACVAYVIY